VATTAAPPRAAPTSARLLAVAYLAGVALATALLLLTTPSYLAEPMPGMTAVMALVGGHNPSHPWLYLLGMGGAMLCGYALVVPFLVAHFTRSVFGRGPTVGAWAPRLALLVITPMATAFSAYLLAHAVGPLVLDWHGPVEALAVLGLVAAPLPLLPAAYRWLRDGGPPWWGAWAIAAGILAIHVGMIPAMLDPGLLGGAQALGLVRWS
jgi:hypothetical protein